MWLNGIIYFLLCISSFLIVDESMLHQDLSYDVYRRNKHIGEFVISRSVSRQSVHIDLHNTTHFWLFGKKKLIYTVKNRFDQGILQTAFSKSMVNHRVRHETKIVKDRSSGYLIYDKHKADTLQLDIQSINYTVAMMYFEEPSTYKEAYSERFQKFLSIRRITSQEYSLELPNGNYNYFTYENGVAREIEVNHPLVTIVFRLKNGSV
ncbi:MAG: hypothetical protein HKN22_04400 [Bacteroidia bacterium]|nr:hypothetical protein [Bacteroidia bacterium]